MSSLKSLPLNPSSAEAYDLLMRRRSVVAKQMTDSGSAPTPEDVEHILKAGMRVPDHGKLEPWRFIVLDKAAQKDFDAIIYRALSLEGTDENRKKAIGYASQAPLCIAVISAVQKAHKIPEWEQILSAGAVCQNMLIAATALGYNSQWLTGWPSYSAHVSSALGLRQDAETGEQERIAGLLFFGRSAITPSERPRPDYKAKVQWGLKA